MEVKIDDSWKQVLKDEFKKEYFTQIVGYLRIEKGAGKTIYPPGSLIFNAFNLTPFDKVKVVLLGQDPYHGAGQAHGLCFSVQDGIKPPPSLVNIFKEINSDIGLPIPKHGNLTPWAQQGVLMLNASLTVRAGEPMSHSRIGWADFTDAVIRKVSEQKQGVVFLLWGKFAQAKQELIDETKHQVLKAAHPSLIRPTAASLAAVIFPRTNEYLVKEGLDPIDWSL